MRDLLKFITCGSVDDGKSTLIGHMLYDAKLIFADQKQAMEMDSKVGAADGAPDYSLLLDGLMAEREQGITIDVAYRFFSTDKRSFIVADTPGHEQYTRNMAVGASFAELALILIDAQKGILEQTRRHAHICALMGIEDYVFAVNKMDLVNYSKSKFDIIAEQVRELVLDYNINSLKIIPVSALNGDNLTSPCADMDWYEGPPLLEYLEEVAVESTPEHSSFIMPVQRVCRPNGNFRGYQGEVVSGKIAAGDAVIVLPEGEEAVISELYLMDRKVSVVTAGMPVTLCLDRELDVSRGSMISSPEGFAIGKSFKSYLVWMDDLPLHEGGSYILRLSTQRGMATVEGIEFKQDIHDGSEIRASELIKNDIGMCRISLHDDMVFDKFSKSRHLGSFILINRLTNATAACGMITGKLNDNLFRQQMSIDRTLHEKLNGHKGVTIWLTGLSGSGKSAMADGLERLLYAEGYHTMILDGDNMRLGISKGLGFSADDRMENIRRTAETAKLLNDAGIIAITALISPLGSDREMARKIIGDSFIEVYVNTPLEICEGRDTKGLYRRAREGEISNFTGISSPYEPPACPDIVIDTSKGTIEENSLKLKREVFGRLK